MKLFGDMGKIRGEFFQITIKSGLLTQRQVVYIMARNR